MQSSTIFRTLFWVLFLFQSAVSVFSQTTVFNITSSGTGAATKSWTNNFCYGVNVRITVQGGGGGNGYNSGTSIVHGGTGATMVGDFLVQPGQTLFAIAGGRGEDASQLPDGKSSGGGGGAGSGVSNLSTGQLLILAAGGSGGDRYGTCLGGSASTSGSGQGGGYDTFAAGGGGVLSNGQSACTAIGGEIVKLNAVSSGAFDCGTGNGEGADGMGGGGGAASRHGGGGGHTGGMGGENYAPATSYNSSLIQSNTDGQNNTNGNQGFVKIEILQKPTLSCKSSTVSLNAQGTATLNPNDFWAPPTSGATCDYLSISPSTVNCSNIGAAVNVTLSAGGGDSPVINCQTTVTVVDNIKPTVFCKSVTANLGANGSAVVSPSAVYNGGSDNCGVVNPESLTQSTFTCSDLGNKLVLLVANDGHGNTAFCSATIIVKDAMAPSITCKNATVWMDNSGLSSVAIADVYQSGTDNCSAVTPVSVSPSTFNCDNYGANLVTLTAKDASGNTSTCTATVTVNDNWDPFLTCKDYTLHLGPNGTGTVTPNDVTQSLTDNCNQAIPYYVEPDAFNCSNLGTQMVAYVVIDNHGNSSICYPKVTVVDDMAPSLNCQNKTVYLDASGSKSITVSDIAPGATDNCGVVNVNTFSPSSFNCSNLGPNQVTLSANDGHGNTSTCTVTVTVADNIAPTAVCKNASVSLNSSGAGSITTAAVFQSGADNCGVVNQQSVVPSSFNCGNLGANTVTLTVNDSHGNTNTCTATVTVTDAVVPTVVCKNATVNLDNAGAGSITTANVFQSGADNCGVVNQQSVTPNSFNCGNLGANTVTLTVNDSHGNTNTCTATVTVVDAVVPTVICKNATVNLDNAGTGSITTANVFQSGADNCGVVNQQSVTPNSFNCGNLGANTVTLTVNDSHGNTNTCTATVTVVDAVVPTVVCKNATVNLDNAGAGSITTANVFQSGADNCGVVNQQSVTPNSFNCGNLGANTVTLTVNDSHGNTNTCTATVTVVDAVVPTVICKNATVNLDNAGTGSITTANVFQSGADNCGVINQQSVTPNSFNCGNLGANTVTLTVNDSHGNTNTCTATVTVVDAVVPTVICKNATVNLDNAGTGSITTANVFQSGADNCGVVNQQSVTPNSFNCGNLGTNTVILTVNDSHGNTNTCTATVTVVDAIAPTVVCKNATVDLNASGSGSITTASVFQSGSDNCGVVNQVSVVPGSFNCANLGANTVTLTVNDGHGNTSTCSATVTVRDLIAPTLLCKAVTLNLDAYGQASLTVAQVNNGSYDNCSIVNYSLSQTEFNCANLGSNTVFLSGNDISGNKAGCSATVTVQDLIIPVAKCKNYLANLNVSGTITVDPSTINNGSSDNCALSMSLTPSSFSCANVGANTVILKVTDGAGNNATCTAVVTIRDLTAPTALCKNPTIYLNDSGQATLTAAQVNNGSYDGCGITSMTISQSQFNCSDLASSIPVTLTLKDPYNNTSSCTAQVTVKDNLQPTAICENTTVQLGSNGTVTVYSQTLASESYDNCSVWSYSPVAKVYTSANTGNNNLLITVKDGSNNAATCTSIVTVKPFNGFGAGQQRDENEGTNQEGTLAVYPNPTTGAVNLAFELPKEQPFGIQLYDQQGRLVLNRQYQGQEGENTIRIDTEGAASGIYTISLVTESVKVQKRLVIQGL